MSRLTVGSLEGLSENSNVVSVPTGHTLNVADGLQIGGVALGTPTSYTPSHTNITVGNGTESARYIRVNKLVFVTYALTWGSTTSFSGNIEVGLPLIAVARAWGMGLITDAGVTNISLEVSVSTGAIKAEVRPLYAASTYAEWNTVINATSPFTWTTNDQLQFSIVYEVA